MTATLLSTLRDSIDKLDAPFFPVERRRLSWSRFQEMGFPTTRWEAWRHTDVADDVKRDFAPATRPPSEGVEMHPYITLPSPKVRLTFINGFFCPMLSYLIELPPGVEAGPLSQRPRAEALGALLSLDQAPFAALNTALFPDGAFVRVARGTASRTPIHMLFLTIPGAGPTLISPRALVMVEENAEAVLMETHAGGAEAHLSAAVTEVDLAPAARLSHLRRVVGLGAGVHVGHVQVRQARASVYRSTALAFGGGLARTHVNVRQEGEGAECLLDGVALARGRERVDNQTLVDHAAPRGTSRETYKYLLNDRARGVFNGEVVIRPGAVKTDSVQVNANLLLSDQALMQTKPDLRIFADDVKAKHGASVGQLDKDMLFYCRSRGLAAAEARRLLTEAFAMDVIGRIADEPLRELALSAVGGWWAEP